MKFFQMMALGGAIAMSCQAAAFNNAMDDYDMGGGTSMNDDLFGFGINSTTWFIVQFNFTNVTFKDPLGGGSFDLTGFDIFQDGTKAGGGTLVGTTDACTGIATPLPAAQTSITCAVPGGVVLSGTPYFVFPRAGSVGLMARTDSLQESSVELSGVPGGGSTVPEPSSVMLTGLGLAAAAGTAVRRRRRA